MSRGSASSALLALVVLAVPAPASAHVRTDVVAVDYRARVLDVPALVARAATVRVYAGDQAVGLTVRAGHRVIVLGYVGEPFIRIGPAGVAVDAASPTAAATRLAGVHSHRRSIVWHDARIRTLPGGARHMTWQIHLIVDGRRVAVGGDIRRVARPSPWPWVALGAPFVLLVAFLIGRRRSAVEEASIRLGLLSAVLTVATATSFALARSASVGRWLEGAAELVFSAIGVGVVARGPSDARGVAGGALGLVAVSCAATKIPVFLHGVVLAAVPSTPARALVAATLWVGLAATAAGLVVFFELLERDEHTALPYAS